MKKVNVILLWLFLAILVLSCKSSDSMMLRDSRETAFPLMAKVFNGNNRACAGVLIELSDSNGPLYSARSDITGKVIFPKIPFGSYQVRMSLSGSETVEFSFDFMRADQALYGRIYSFEQILQMADQALQEGKWDQTESFINRAEVLEVDPSRVLWYRAILFWKQSRNEEALAILQEVLAMTDAPVETHLFMADIYQYRLMDFEKALEHLHAYQRVRNDMELDNRIAELESEKESEETHE